SYLGATAVSPIVTKGQAEVFFTAVRQQAIDGRDAPRAEELERVLADQSAFGLRYVALVGEGRRVLASAGAPWGGDKGDVVDLPQEGEMRRVGDRIRILSAPPPKPPGEDEAPARAPPPRDGPLGEGEPPRPEPPRPEQRLKRRPPVPLPLIEL